MSASEKTAADFRVTAKDKGTAKEIFKHVGRLKYQDEDWKTRDEVLERLQQLIQDGALARDDFISGGDGFDANLRDLNDSLTTQIYDDRSSIVKSAIATLELLMAEIGDHAASEDCMRVETLECLLQLANKGNKVLSKMGRDALKTFVDCVRFESVVSDASGSLLSWLGGMKQVPVKLACLSALLQVLQTWPTRLLCVGTHEQVERSCILAATHVNGEVRVLARQCLLLHLHLFPSRDAEVQKWTKKNSNYLEVGRQMDKDTIKHAGLAVAERLPNKVRHGDAGARERNSRLGGGPNASSPNDAGLMAAAREPTRKKPGLMKQMSAKFAPGFVKSALKTPSDSAPLGGAGGGGTGAAHFTMKPADTTLEQRSAKERLVELKELLDDGLVTQDEFDEKRKAIITGV